MLRPPGVALSTTACSVAALANGGYGGDMAGGKQAPAPVGRPQTRPNAQNMLVKGPGDIGGDLRALCPPTFTVGLDGLDGSLQLPREDVCKNAKKRRS